jgi:hypothetical protein
VLLAETHDRSRVKFLDKFHTSIVRVVLGGSSEVTREGWDHANRSSCITARLLGESVGDGDGIANYSARLAGRQLGRKR